MFSKEKEKSLKTALHETRRLLQARAVEHRKVLQNNGERTANSIERP